MVDIVWEFRIRPEMRSAFEARYSSSGSWAMLFRQSPEYLGTILVQDVDEPNRYLTIDRWTTLGAYDTFKESAHDAYAGLDSACAELSVEERLLGRFEVR